MSLGPAKKVMKLLPAFDGVDPMRNASTSELAPEDLLSISAMWALTDPAFASVDPATWSRHSAVSCPMAKLPPLLLATTFPDSPSIRNRRIQACVFAVAVLHTSKRGNPHASSISLVTDRRA